MATMHKKYYGSINGIPSKDIPRDVSLEDTKTTTGLTTTTNTNSNNRYSIIRSVILMAIVAIVSVFGVVTLVNPSSYLSTSYLSSTMTTSIDRNQNTLKLPSLDFLKKDNGRLCFSDKVCASNSCCPHSYVGTIGRCTDCCSDLDCVKKIEQPPGGEFGKPFCIEDKCVAHVNNGGGGGGGGTTSSQIPEEGYPTWIPSDTIDNGKENRKLVMPRTVVYSENTPKPLFEQVWYFDFNEQDPTTFTKDDVKYNGTHITIPSWEMMHAGYSRSYHTYDEHETGIVTLVTGDNEHSLVADYPKLSFVEKYHTLTYDGKKDTARGDYIKALSEEQGMNDDWSYRKWLAHSVAKVLSLLNKSVITTQVQAGVDRALNWQIRRYVNSYANEDVHTLTPSSSTSWASHSEKAKQAINHAKNIDFEREYKKSEQHCKHFEDGSGVDSTDTHVIFPLGRPITTFSGEMVNSPVYYLGFVVGYVTAHYDVDTNVFQIYYQGYTHSRQYSDVKFPGPYPSGLYVSPVAEGSDYTVDPNTDGRGDSDVLLEQLPANKVVLSEEKADFTLWNRPRSETCKQRVEDGSFWKEIDIVSKRDNTIFDSLVDKKKMLTGVVAGMPCGNKWMKSDYGKGTNGFGVNEVSVWAHFLAEVPDIQAKRMGVADWWDSWECFYGKKDQKLCTED